MKKEQMYLYKMHKNRMINLDRLAKIRIDVNKLLTKWAGGGKICNMIVKRLTKSTKLNEKRGDPIWML